MAVGDGTKGLKVLVLTLPEEPFLVPYVEHKTTNLAERCAIILKVAPTKGSQAVLTEGMSESSQGFTLLETAGYDSFIVSSDEEGGEPPPSRVGAELKGEKRPARQMTHFHCHLLLQC